MYETDADLAELQRMFDAHLAGANPHMRGIVTPKRRLSARHVARYLTGIKHVALATVTPKGEPRVSPLDTLFIRGRFTLSTGGQAARPGGLPGVDRCARRRRPQSVAACSKSAPITRAAVGKA